MTAGDRIGELRASAYTIPTGQPESDGTLQWDSTTLVLVEITGMGKTGIGYTYADSSAAQFINKRLASVITGQSPFDTGKIFNDLSIAIRNEGQCGLAYTALSAIDVAFWDLKSRILDIPLCELIGKTRDQALIYGSGGFTSYSDEVLEKQLGGWAQQGFSAVKMKIGRQPDKDPQRVRKAREAIGENVQLFVDANGALTAKQALSITSQFMEQGISWFEEPVSSDNLDGLRFIREHVPARVQIAAGEYGYTGGYFLNMLQKGAVDVLQADATRCGGISGFLKAAYLAQVFQVPFSFHCAPALHLHPSLCVPDFYIGEYFHDHVRMENLLFDGAPKPINGFLQADLSQPGIGLTIKHRDAEKYKVS